MPSLRERTLAQTLLKSSLTIYIQCPKNCHSNSTSEIHFSEKIHGEINNLAVSIVVAHVLLNSKNIENNLKNHQ